MPMAVSFRTNSSNSGPKIPGRELRIPGTRENIVGRDGDINGYNKKDLFRTISHLMTMAANGQVDFSDSAPADQRAVKIQEARDRRELLLAAYNDKSTGKWAELGSVIAAQITESAEREGFMRRLLDKAPLEQGNFPRIRVKKKNVTALMMSTNSAVQPQYVRDPELFPPEFTISTNIRVTNRDLNQGSADLLEEKYLEAQEAIMTTEDRHWKRLADSTVGIDHPLRYLAGGLNPTSFTEMRTELNRFNIVPMYYLMASDFWNDITGNTQFSSWFDPATKYEIVNTGELGSMMGLSFITDGFRQEQLKVLEAGESYMIGESSMHGAYTDRGPVQSQEVNNFAEGTPARGHFLFEDLSMVIANARSVLKAKRI